MIVRIYELIVTVVSRAVTVSVAIEHVVWIVVDGPVAVVVTSCWPEDPVSVDVVRVRSIHIRIPVIGMVPVIDVHIRVSVWHVIVVHVTNRSVAERTVIETSVERRTDRTIHR